MTASSSRAASAEGEPVSDAASSCTEESSGSGSASGTHRLHPRVYEIRSPSTVRMPDVLTWHRRKHVTVTRCEKITLILLRMSLGSNRSFDWLSRTIVQKRDWAAYRRRGFTGELETKTVNTRDPPLPYWQNVNSHQCPICGQPTFGRGAWWPEAGPALFNKRWHVPCTTTYNTWRHADFLAESLAERQGGICAETGEPLFTYRGERRFVRAEVDHRIPLWRVRRDAALYNWPDVLKFWGPTNLQALSPAGHKIKTAREARERANRGI